MHNQTNTLLITENETGKIVTIATFEDSFILEVLLMYLNLSNDTLHDQRILEAFGFGDISCYCNKTFTFVWIDEDSE